MSDPHGGGQIQPQLDVEEHNHAATAKRVVPMYLQEDGATYENAVFHPKAGTNTLFTLMTVPKVPGTVLMAAANTARRKISISNHTVDSRLYLGPTGAVTNSQGIPLTRDGSLIDDGIHLATTDWYGSGSVTCSASVILWEE